MPKIDYKYQLDEPVFENAYYPYPFEGRSPLMCEYGLLTPMGNELVAPTYRRRTYEDLTTITREELNEDALFDLAHHQATKDNFYRVEFKVERPGEIWSIGHFAVFAGGEPFNGASFPATLVLWGSLRASISFIFPQEPEE